MVQGKIFEEGGALPDGYSLGNYLFGETFSKINVEPLKDEAQALIKKFIEDPKMSAIKMSHPKAISAYGNIIKEHHVKDKAEIIDMLVAREFIKQHYVENLPSDNPNLAISIIDDYLQIKNKMSEKIINAEELEKISSLLPNIVYKELKAYTTGAEPEVSVESVAPVVEVVEPIVEVVGEPKELSVDEKIKSFTGKINGYKIKLKRASAEDAEKIAKKIKGYEIKLKGLAIKKKNGGTILEEGGVMGDVFTIEDPKEFQQVDAVFNELMDRFGVEREYTDHNAKRVVFILKDSMGAADIYQIKEYWNTLKGRGFDVFDYDTTAFKKPFQTLTSNSFYFKLKDSVKYKEGGNVIEATSSVQDPKPTGADELSFTHTSHDPEQMATGGGVAGEKKYVMTAYSADVVEDSYEEGEIGNSVSDWHLKESKEFDSKQKLIDYMNKLMYVDYKEEHFNWEDGEGKNIQTDVLCSMDSQGDFSPASEREKELWKKGEKKLYNCHYWFYVLPVTVHDSYAKGGGLGKMNEKLEKKYPNWEYPVPPVYTGNWTLKDWSNWIDKNGINKHSKYGGIGDSVHINDTEHELNGKAGLILGVDGDNYKLKVLNKGNEVDVVIAKSKTTPFPEDID